jgi:hypothetical protein
MCEQVSRLDWVDVVAGLKFATEHGCMSPSPIPLDERESRDAERHITRQDTLQKYAGWIAGDTCEETG